MKKFTWTLALTIVATLLSACPAFAVTLDDLADEMSLPNGTLNITYQQRQDGKLSDSVHDVELSCWNGSCTLTTMTLNQCFFNDVFIAKQEEVSTKEGTLIVMVESETSLLAEQKIGGITGDGTIHYRFVYKVRTDVELQEMTRMQSAKFFDGITDFKGSAVKHSTFMQNEFYSWDLIPLHGKFPKLLLSCPASLHGIPTDFDKKPELSTPQIIGSLLNDLWQRTPIALVSYLEPQPIEGL